MISACSTVYVVFWFCCVCVVNVRVPLLSVVQILFVQLDVGVIV